MACPSPLSFRLPPSSALQDFKPAINHLHTCLPSTSYAGATAAQVEALFTSHTCVPCTVVRLLSRKYAAQNESSTAKEQAMAALGLVLGSAKLTAHSPALNLTASQEDPPFQSPVKDSVAAMAGTLQATSAPGLTAIANISAETEDSQQIFVVSYASESEGAVQSSYGDFRRMGLCFHGNIS